MRIRGNRRGFANAVSWAISGLVLILAGGCVTADEPAGKGVATPVGTSVPSWKASYAAKEVGAGQSWRVYLDASDPDGDIQFISVLLNASGRESGWMRLQVEPDQRASLSGRLEVSTSDLGRGGGAGWVRAVVILEDRAGHRSEPLGFVATMEMDARPVEPPPGSFPDRFLGGISVGSLPRISIGP